jgi:hypothetical protein
MQRDDLTKMVILLDLVICLLFIILTYGMRVCTIKEINNIQNKVNMLTDFTVELRNLPEQEVYGTLDELKAKLQVHLEMVCKKEEPVIAELKGK